MLVRYFELAEYVARERALVGDDAFVTQQSCNRLREMWCAAVFSEGYENRIGPCEVEIAEEDEQRDYDFLFHALGKVFPFQITEVLDEGRKRNLEYREGNQVQFGDWVVPEKYAHERLRQAIKSKIKKQYSNSRELHLLLYANFLGKDASWGTLVANLSDLCCEFGSVWVITGAEFCCISSGAPLHGFSQWRRIND
jgi:hypothetical protein